MVTLNLVLNFSIRSASSNTDLLPIASMISSLLSSVALAIVVSLNIVRGGSPFALSAQRLERAGERGKHTVERAGEPGQRRLERGAEVGQELLPRRHRRELRYLGLVDRPTIEQPAFDLRL